MPLSEINRIFDERRKELAPYGLTVERWRPNLMRKSDRHNEIELNFLQRGSVTYMLRGRRYAIRPGRLTLFWALAPHQIVEIEGDAPYYVATIPLTRFLQWKLPAAFVNRVLQGEVIEERSDAVIDYDAALFARWLDDVATADVPWLDLVLLEMEARVRRLALTSALSDEEAGLQPIDDSRSSTVERMAVFVAAHYKHAIQVHEIAEAVDLHPDYATALFRKTFGMTLSDYLADHRIAHAQRMLATSPAKITEIAYESGFNSISRFNAAFKKHCGCTPRTYRKQHTSRA
ncbi:MAG: helix-turn-helix domain-containing protein [Rhodothermales bacterium]|nr:helix-turn-helix domain-containing protein [Rhodothermales bacterium]